MQKQTFVALASALVIAPNALAQPAPPPPPAGVVPPAPATPSAPVTAAPVAPGATPAPEQPAPPIVVAAAQPTTPAVAAPPPAAVAPPNCQPCKRQDEPAEGFGAFFMGLGFFDFASLNHRLRAAGYDPITNPVTLIGGEGHAVMPTGFVMGARGGAILEPDGAGPTGLTRSFGGGFGMLDLGYAFVQRPAFLLTLTTGIGGYGLNLGLGDGQSVPFDEVLQNPRRSSSLSRGGLLLGLTLGIDGRVPIGKDAQGRHGFFTLGARIGGLWGPALGAWGLSEGGDATHGPGGGLTGGFGSIIVGFGGGNQSNP